MKTIILIACVSRKGTVRAKAKNLYKGPLFTNSLAYAFKLKADKIFILSALHHLIELDKEIEPYDVTLSNVPKAKRKPGLKVLSAIEKGEWGETVIKLLSEEADLQKDKFIVLAGQEYIKPIKARINYLDNPLAGRRQGQRVAFLKAQL